MRAKAQLIDTSFASTKSASITIFPDSAVFPTHFCNISEFRKASSLLHGPNRNHIVVDVKMSLVEMGITLVPALSNTTTQVFQFVLPSGDIAFRNAVKSYFVFCLTALSFQWNICIEYSQTHGAAQTVTLIRPNDSTGKYIFELSFLDSSRTPKSCVIDVVNGKGSSPLSYRSPDIFQSLAAPTLIIQKVT